MARRPTSAARVAAENTVKIEARRATELEAKITELKQTISNLENTISSVKGEANRANELVRNQRGQIQELQARLGEYTSRAKSAENMAEVGMQQRDAMMKSLYHAEGYIKGLANANYERFVEQETDGYAF